MPTITVERTIGTTKKAVLAGLGAYNDEKFGKQKVKSIAVSLKDGRKIAGGIVGHLWGTVLFIQYFWIDQKQRGQEQGQIGQPRMGRNEGDEGIEKGRHVFLEGLEHRGSDPT